MSKIKMDLETAKWIADKAQEFHDQMHEDYKAWKNGWGKYYKGGQ